MNVTAESYGHTVLLNVNGELTEDSQGALKEAVDHQLASQDVVDVVINAEGVPFIDSIVLEYLLDLQDSLIDRLGQVKFTNCSENVALILKMTRLDNDFEQFTDIAEAVKSIAP